MKQLHPRQLLGHSNHRPWPLPSGPWNFHQEWRNALFLHFRAVPDELGRLLPAGLEPDLLAGSAWVSVVAFTMQRVHPRGLPAWRPISDFHEMNVRTYVRGPDRKAGVYFLHIAGANWVSVRLARGLSILPYRKANIRRSFGPMEQFDCSGSGPSLHVEYNRGEQIRTPTKTDLWLTERYALYQERDKGIWRYQVHHLPWPLQAARIQGLEFFLEAGPTLAPQPDLAHWSEGVQVLSWPREPARN
jgi:uncharacterized protein YqjF (DUF2071 family)